MCCVLVFCLFFPCVLCVQCFQFLWIVNSWLPVWPSIMFFTISYTNCNKPVDFFFNYQIKKSCVLWIKIRKHSHYAIRNRSYMFTTNRTIPLLYINIVKPVKLQRSPLKPPIQPYVQFQSNLSHILLINVSQQDSQLTPNVRWTIHEYDEITIKWPTDDE